MMGKRGPGVPGSRHPGLIENFSDNGEYLLYGEGRELARQRQRQIQKMREQREALRREDLVRELEELIKEGANSSDMAEEAYRELFDESGATRRLRAYKEAVREFVAAERKLDQFSWPLSVITPALATVILQGALSFPVGAWAALTVFPVVAVCVYFNLRRSSRLLGLFLEAKSRFDEAGNEYQDFCSKQITFETKELKRRDRIRELISETETVSNPARSSE